MLKDLRKQIVLTAYKAGEGHIASAFSILEIVWTLHNWVMKPDDVFILSKGHGCLALYTVLAELGKIPKGELDLFCKKGGTLGGHPTTGIFQAISASTGSLGHGLPIAVGRALAKKIKNEPGKVFCLIGDGEANEGSVWEACLLAAHHKLDNLVVVVDNNHSTDRALGLDSLYNKFESFGFATLTAEGHSLHNLDVTFRHMPYDPAPVAVIADTIKGHGCDRMREPEWHHKVPASMWELSEILKEIDEKATD